MCSVAHVAHGCSTPRPLGRERAGCCDGDHADVLRAVAGRGGLWFRVVWRDLGLPTSNGLQPTSDGLQPTSNGGLERFKLLETVSRDERLLGACRSFKSDKHPLD